MTAPSDKPKWREWWIETRADGSFSKLWQTDPESGFANNLVQHVIEHSAYAKLQAERDQLKECLNDRENDWKRVKAAEQELDELYLLHERTCVKWEADLLKWLAVVQERDALKAEVDRLTNQWATYAQGPSWRHDEVHNLIQEREALQKQLAISNEANQGWSKNLIEGLLVGELNKQANKFKDEADSLRLMAVSYREKLEYCWENLCKHDGEVREGDGRSLCLLCSSWIYPTDIIKMEEIRQALQEGKDAT